jgi:hypothetical protein
MCVWVAGKAVAGVCGGYRVRDYLLCSNMNNSICRVVVLACEFG